MGHNLWPLLAYIRGKFSQITSFREKYNEKMSNFHIFGKSEIIRELPFHVFEGNETIAVKKLIIEWESKESEACVMITSTLIDKGPQNLRQQLCSFVKSPTS